MNSSREELLFQLVLTKPESEREDWLDRECGDDVALRSRLEAMLAAHEQPATELGEAGESTVKADPFDQLRAGELDEAIGQTLAGVSRSIRHESCL